MTTREIADNTRGLMEKRFEHKSARFYHVKAKKPKDAPEEDNDTK